MNAPTPVQLPGQPQGDALAAIPERLGDFRLIEKLGGGGMGVVYVAEQVSLRRTVALKLIRPENLWFEGARERFRREAEAVAKLQHPGIVPVLTFGEEAGIPYFAMERVAGLTLGEVLAKLAGRDPAKLTGADLRALVATGADASNDSAFAGTWVQVCLRLARQVAEALDHAHRRGVIHRDVKPSNVMVTSDGRALLFDFGVSTNANASAAGDAARLTRSGSFVGSLPYSPPEQVRGDRDAVSPATDVYALGVALYELLTLDAPFHGDTIDRLQREIVDGRPRPPRELNSGLPWDAETVCLTAMEADRRRRYASAAEFAQDLGNVLELRPIAAKRPSVALRARRWVQRHPTLSTAAVAAVLLLIVGPSVAWVKIRAERDVAAAERDRADGERDRAAKEANVAKSVTEFFVSALRGADPSRGEGDLTMREFLRRIRDEIPSKILEPKSRAVLLSHMGDISLELGDVQAAQRLLDEALALHLAEYGEASQETATVHILSAKAAIALGKIDVAAAQANAAIASSNAAANQDESMIATAESVLGSAHLMAGRFGDAEAAFRRAADRQRKLADSRGVLSSLGALATALLYDGNVKDAEVACREALALEAADPSHPPGLEGASVRNTLAMIRKEMHDLDEAERLYGESAAVYRRLGLERHPDLGTILNNQAIVMEERGDLDGATPLFENALAISRGDGPATAASAMIEMELARNLSRCKREADAEPHFRASLEAMRAAQGSDPYYRAICARLFGELLVGKERPAEAHPLFVESLEAYQASGRNEPGVAERLRHMIEQTAGN